MVHQVTDKEDFDKQVADAGGKLIVVDFFATWCGPCKMIAPKIEAMEAEFSDVVFLKVDVDENEELAGIHNISCMPTFIFFKGGGKVDTLSGANEAKIRELLTKHK